MAKITFDTGDTFSSRKEDYYGVALPENKAILFKDKTNKHGNITVLKTVIPKDAIPVDTDRVPHKLQLAIQVIRLVI